MDEHLLRWIDGFGERNALRRKLPTIVAGLVLGVLVLTRPLTAVAVAFPFAFHGLYLLVRSDWQTRGHVLAVGCIALGVGAITFCGSMPSLGMLCLVRIRSGGLTIRWDLGRVLV